MMDLYKGTQLGTYMEKKVPLMRIMEIMMMLIVWKSLLKKMTSELLKDLACGLDDRGDFEDNSSVQPSDELLALQRLVEANSQELYPT